MHILYTHSVLQIDGESQDNQKLTRVKDYFGAGKEPPVIRPKPKPKPKPKPIKPSPSHTDQPDGDDRLSPEVKVHIHTKFSIFLIIHMNNSVQVILY